MMKPKTIFVLGASRGIGRETVKLLAEGNHEIIAISRNLDKMNREFEGLQNVTCYSLDLNSSDVRTKAELIIANHTTIDLLINNAGVLVNKAFTELTHEDLVLSYQTNIIGIMEFTQAAVAKMENGHIVNISSIGGFQGSVKFPGLSAYSTSKAALCSFTELFAEEYKETGIKMNCLCLGAVQTEMLEEAFPGYEAMISPEKMAEYIAHFALTADQWMNGKIIPVSLSTP